MNIQTDIIKPPKQDIFKSGKFRSLVIQAIVMVLFIGSVLWIINNAATNMKANGIAHGFDFLWENSMFDIVYLPFINHTPLALARAGSPNAGWKNGGLIYAPPIR